MNVTIADRAPALQNGPRAVAMNAGGTGLETSVRSSGCGQPDSCRHASSVPAEGPESRRTAIAERQRNRIRSQPASSGLHGEYDVRHVVA